MPKASRNVHGIGTDRGGGPKGSRTEKGGGGKGAANKKSGSVGTVRPTSGNR